MPKLVLIRLCSAPRYWAVGASLLGGLALAVCVWRLGAQSLVNPLPLTFGQPVAGQADGTGGNIRYFLLHVPSHAQGLTLSLTGGLGDADLVLRQFGQTDWAYFTEATGNDDTLNVTQPASGDWLVGIYTYEAYTNVTLTATVQSLAIQSARRELGQALVSFTEIGTNRFYSLQRAVELGSNTTWVTVAQGIGAAVPESLVDTNAPGGSAFYRVIEALSPPPGWDGDGDGVEDILELTTHRTNPRLADTDGDGWSDGAELDAATDPLNSASTPRFTVMAGGGVSLTLLRDYLTIAPGSLSLLRDYLTIAPSTVLLTRSLSSTNGVGGQ